MRTGARVGEGGSHHNLDPQPLSVEAVMLVAESDKRISCRHISPLVIENAPDSRRGGVGAEKLGRRRFNYVSINTN